MNSTRNRRIIRKKEKKLKFAEGFNEAIPVMENEVRSFFTSFGNQPGYLFDIGDDFWEKCEKEFPNHLYLIHL
jgi:hypothetical protein